ncbi:extensin precursor [Iris pallida]|uniref:Extensin n=1 Tax=Iris pallida TaxID=29817 RepID=A0AAX6G263_IRIPA|nr:extensin precursor [Iris pallida]
MTVKWKTGASDSPERVGARRGWRCGDGGSPTGEITTTMASSRRGARAQSSTPADVPGSGRGTRLKASSDVRK